MKHLWILCFLLYPGFGFGQELPLVPQPVSIVPLEEAGLSLPAVWSVQVPAEWQPHLRVFAGAIRQCTGGRYQLQAADDSSAVLTMRADAALPPEAYRLKITGGGILLEASELKGLAHGTATLLQLVGASSDSVLPAMQIEDAPRLSYRNFMIDMGRNAHSIELLKETVDLLWFYKVDSVHLHLTDDQRFAWPSEAFPKLWDGEITLQEFRDLEAYAVERGVTIIPELEVPGHSSILRSAYPEVFGETPTELAESDRAFEGICTLLDEMAGVFASTPYIHVGGDEAYGVPEELQRDLINRLAEHLKSQGRQTIVWEGPRGGSGANKVDTEVIHINWRTIAYPADQMLRDGYRVVNAAWDPLYIVDHYPRINFTMTSPQHIYETLSLTRFKHVNPGIPTFARPVETEPSDRLIGFCIPWWEGREENYFAQNVPRLIPFAEVAWIPEIQRDFAGFDRRAQQTEALRQATFYPVTIAAAGAAVPADDVYHQDARVTLSADASRTGEIRYTLDGSTPAFDSAVYSEPILVDRTTIIRAALFVDGVAVGHGSRRRITVIEPISNLALGKPVVSSVPSAAPFSVGRLTDGGIGNLDFYLGYPAQPEPVSVTVDLQEDRSVNRIMVYAYSISGSAENYAVSVSRDGQSFQEIGEHRERPSEPVRPRPDAAVPVEFTIPEQPVRYVRIHSAGNHGYVFDSFSKLVEIQVFGP